MKIGKIATILLLNILLIQAAIAVTPPPSVDPGAVQSGAESTRTNETQKNTIFDKSPSIILDTEDSVKETMEGESFYLQEVTLETSIILSEADIDAITSKYEGQTVTINDLYKMLEEINALYDQKGYFTARAFLPDQHVSNGIVKIKLIEAKLGEITIENSKYTRPSFFDGKINLEEGELLDLNRLEKDIIKLNKYNNTDVSVVLQPGQAFGTTDLIVKENDQFPFHLTGTFDNIGRETIGVLRGGVAATHDSVFGFRDQFTAGYARAKTTNLAYSSYSVPIGDYGTRLVGTFSYTDLKINSGPFKQFNITGNSFNYGGYITHPFYVGKKLTIDGDIGVNFKQVTTFFDKNPILKNQIRSLTTGINFEYRDNHGRWLSRHAFVNGLDILGGSEKFFKYNGYAARVHNFGHGIYGILTGMTQLTDDALPPIEQFQLGGNSSVRGYSEGLLLGDSGYLFSGELRFPIPVLPEKVGPLKVRDRIKAVVFCDHGGTFPDDGGFTSPNAKDYLTSVGVGLRAYLTDLLVARLDWGFGLGQRETPQPTARFHFGLQSSLIDFLTRK